MCVCTIILINGERTGHFIGSGEGEIDDGTLIPGSNVALSGYAQIIPSKTI